jgi:hypothetical protein
VHFVHRSVILIIICKVPLQISSFIKVQKSGASLWLSMTKQNFTAFEVHFYRSVEISQPLACHAEGRST